ncbi:aldo/keto reductase [Cellulosimicrobium sp. CUA-896]|uniref:aldo/keto reductase n=1 Tax=Cellulosimicrobium sp. CUA-896 TaxID=1517881 RepID=UPI0009618A24|nr:aldo/keto reductase [Cellulosimicrobium sp. CUA-896]OLT52279.1 oxidoreductase [Cellulosimicrobium sp. CUA-896]
MSDQTTTQDLRLNNGVTLPPLGFGVFQTPPDETAAVVRTALETGYRHIDTAASYQNETGVGEGLRNSGIPREEVFVETKIWVSDFGYDETLHAYDKSAAKLGLDHIDLLILHQPLASMFDRTVGAYRALEKLLADGRVRAIGVSNFQPDDLANLAERTEIVPAVNQVELHPYAQQKALQQRHAELGILTQAWSPIGGITFYPGFMSGETDDSQRSTLEDPVLNTIGREHGRSAAQVMLRWHLQQGRSAIPKSVNPQRIAENFDVFDFSLTDEELARIDALDTGESSWKASAEMDQQFVNFDIPEA